MYGDKCKIIAIIKEEEDSIRLQIDIDEAVEWSHIWLMPFNIDKCKVMQIGRTTKRSNYRCTMTHEKEIRKEIEVTRVERNLGIQVSQDLKERNQVDTAATMANKALCRLKKCFRSRSLPVWRILYLEYIRPHLKYAVQAWAPHVQRDTDTLERVQQRATKIIYSIKHLSYEERLRRLNITTLDIRRERGSLIEQYKIFKRIDEVDLFVPKIQPTWLTSATYSMRRSHNRLLQPPIVKGSEEPRHFFTNRVTSKWNSLTQKAVDAVNAFEDQLVIS